MKRLFYVMIVVVMMMAGYVVGYMNGIYHTQNDGDERTGNVENAIEQDESVWVSANGERYHITSDCGNLKYAYQITLESAVKKGYKACKTCYKY